MIMTFLFEQKRPSEWFKLKLANMLREHALLLHTGTREFHKKYVVIVKLSIFLEVTY